MSLLELRHVSKAYNEKVLALDDVNLTVEKGEWLKLFRENSAEIIEKVKPEEVSLVAVDEEILSPLTSISFYGHELTVYGTAENPLFVASEVAQMIDYAKNRNGSYKVDSMTRSLDSEEKMVLTIRGRSGNTLSTTLLTEDGFYEVLLQSRKPVAKELKKKVKEALPAKQD